MTQVNNFPILIFEKIDQRFILQESEFNYLKSHLIQLNKKSEVKGILENQIFKIELYSENLCDFQLTMESILESALLEFYESPNLKHVQKHHSGYERFVFKGKKYTVYTTFVSNSRLIWLMYSILISTIAEISKDGKVIIEKKAL